MRKQMMPTYEAAVALVRELGLWLADDVGALDEALVLGLLTDGEHYLCRIYAICPVS